MMASFPTREGARRRAEEFVKRGVESGTVVAKFVCRK
jgi:hypothetical protein